MTSRLVTLSRYLATAMGVFFSLVVVGGFSLGFLLMSGTYLALSSMAAGVVLSCYLWLRFSAERGVFDGLNFFVLTSFVMAAGIALYVNLTYAIWALGYPMSIGTVRDGRMGEHYWVGPMTLIYAVVCYAALKFFIKRSKV